MTLDDDGHDNRMLNNWNMRWHNATQHEKTQQSTRCQAIRQGNATNKMMWHGSNKAWCDMKQGEHNNKNKYHCDAMQWCTPINNMSNNVMGWCDATMGTWQCRCQGKKQQWQRQWYDEDNCIDGDKDDLYHLISVSLSKWEKMTVIILGVTNRNYRGLGE